MAVNAVSSAVRGLLSSSVGALPRARRLLPVATILAVLVVVWYAAAVLLNSKQVLDRVLHGRPDWTMPQLVSLTLSMQRPVIPAPHQVASEFYDSTVRYPVFSPHSLVFHGFVTSSATIVGFALGALLGMGLAVLIVHSRTLDRSLLPWLIATQAVPILAIAPIVIVLLGNLGLTGLFPKAVISMYLCFFPITVGMVKGLRSPEVYQIELLETYSASRAQVFWKLRLPASLPFLLPSLRVAIAAGLVGAIVGELPTGAEAGLGARLLNGSYYGNTKQIWAALLMAALLGLLLSGIVALAEKFVLNRWQGTR